MKKVLLASIGGSTPGAKPLSISLLSAIIKQKGHSVIYFDTTFMDLGFLLDGEISDSLKQFKKVDWAKFNIVRNKDINAKEEFLKLIQKEEPDVIAVSCMSDMYSYTIEFLKESRRFGIPTILGGVHSSLLPEEVISEDVIDAICVGEGEEAIVEFIESIQNKTITKTEIQNLWIKKNGTVYKNKLRPLVDLNALPFLDYSIYEERQFLRAYVGKIYRSGDTQDTRGCPRNCPYCVNEFLNKLYPHNRIRFYSPERFVEEMEYLTKTWKLEFFKIFSEDMLLRNVDEFAQLSELYRKKVNIPFTSHAHPDTVTVEKAKLLKNMNCVSISMALESGNYLYRSKVLKRKYSNDKFKKSVKILMNQGIRVAVLNMLGMPFETKEMIYDTFQTIYETKPSHANFSIFFPYRGTTLGDICIDFNFVKKDEVVKARWDMSKSILDSPYLSRRDINFLRKMSNTYIKYPRLIYPIIELLKYKYD